MMPRTSKRIGWATLGPWLGCVLGAALIFVARPRLLVAHRSLGEAEDVTALPKREQLDLFSLGYKAALADYLFATTLVRAGRHFVQKRNFTELGSYLRAIVHLEPYLLAVYQYADSMLTLNTVTPPPENYRQARELLELGLERFPGDADLWLSAGQFMLYVAPPWLPKNEDSVEWKARGAQVLQRACELRADDPPAGCISSLRALTGLGEAEAQINAMKRMLALSDNPEFRATLMARLAEVTSLAEGAKISGNALELSRRRMLDLPLLSNAEYQIAGPKVDLRTCMEGTADECATSFRDASASPVR
jgi:tetratricopeptide (TPR) repeat protein